MIFERKKKKSQRPNTMGLALIVLFAYAFWDCVSAIEILQISTISLVIAAIISSMVRRIAFRIDFILGRNARISTLIFVSITIAEILIHLATKRSNSIELGSEISPITFLGFAAFDELGVL